MTVSSGTSRSDYAGNGSTSDFATGFRFLQNADLKVILTVVSTGIETVQTLNSDYTVVGAGLDSGGTVSMAIPPATGETLTIKRNVSLTQDTDYVDNDDFPAESHEQALDKLTMITQQIQEESDRSLKLTESQQSSGLTIPPPDNGKFLQWDENGNLLNVNISSLGAISITDFGQDLINSETATAARSVLELESGAVTEVGTAAVEDVGVSPGDVVQLDGGGLLPAVDGSQLTNLPDSGVVKQIKRLSPALTSTVSVSSTSFAPVPGLAAPAITMSDAANGVRVSAIVTGGSSSTNVATFIEVYRDGAAIYQGDAAGSRVRTFSSFSQGNSNETYLDSKAIVFTDFPGDTAAHTYQVYAKTASGTGYINRTATDADNASYSRGVSTIEVMEVTE